MTSTTSWTVGNAKTIFAKLTKIANEQLDVAAEPADDSMSAGPQEVVDALEVIVQQLEEVQEAIPAESSMEEMVDGEMMEQLNESTHELKKMEKTQREIIKKTSKINQELRKKQSEKFESLVEKFFEELKKDVKSIRSTLNDDKK